MNWKLHHRDATESTNLDARAGGHGDVYTADYQSAGRGRLDHRWLSPPKTNLMMSAVVSVADMPVDQAATLPLAAGLAVCRALSPMAKSTPMLKWPNDVLIDGKKVCGILCERHGDLVIVGIGVNVKPQSFPPEIAARATTLGLESVESVRDAVLKELGEVYERWHDVGFAAVYPEIAAIDFLAGCKVRIRQTDDDGNPVEGLCGGVQLDGSLEVCGCKVFAGEATVEGYRPLGDR